MPSGQDHISVDRRLSSLAGVEDEAAERPSMVQNPDMQSNPAEGRQRQSCHATDILVMVRVQRVMQKYPEVSLRGRHKRCGAP